MDVMLMGYFCVVDGYDFNEWYGWSKDVELVSEFIWLWVICYGCWGSLFYFFGELYGIV